MERSPSAQARSPVPVLFLTVFLDILGFAIVLPLLPQMLEHYVGLERQASWFGRLVDGLAAASGSSAPENVEAMFGAVLMGIYSALQFLFAPFWGALSDRVGRRPVLLVTVWGIAASYLLWLFSGSFLLLVAARLLGGVMSGNIATATAAVADATTPEDRPKGMGMIGAAIGLGFTLGPALGALLGSRRLDLAAAFPDLQRFGVNPFSTAAAGSFLLAAANWVWLWARFAETLRPEDRGTAREARRTIDPVRMFRRVEHPGVNLAFWSYFLYFVALSGMESTLTFLTKERLGFTPGKNGI
ncbi:MAG: MFS transporter, partial [Planctomycetes bacterium]|nr:MFS transporter [Planctomycetota bacterium]